MQYMTINIDKERWKTYVIGVCIIVGLFARDMFGIGINKYIFLLLAIIPIMFAKTKSVAVFLCFVIPLYVGLPGNLISVFFLVRLIYDALKYRITISKTGFGITLLVTVYIALQDLFTGYTEIYHLMAALDFIVLALIMSILREHNAGTEAIVAYSVGNFVVGVVMLSATMSYYSLQDLMNPATRLGYTGMLIGNSGASMATSIDPNFYAMNTIACISTVCFIFRDIDSKKERILALFSVIGSTICCLIGLSRTFIILLVIWGVFWLISQGNIKRTLWVLVIASVLVFAFFHFMPTVAEGLLNRFEGADVAGGNGRINLIILYFKPWFETIQSILFGIGLFNCHTHCTPLMYLFGLGIVGALILTTWFIYQWRQCKQCGSKHGLKGLIPLLLTLIAYSSIPAAGAINYTLPVLISMIVLAIPNKVENIDE